MARRPQYCSHRPLPPQSSSRDVTPPHLATAIVSRLRSIHSAAIPVSTHPPTLSLWRAHGARGPPLRHDLIHGEQVERGWEIPGPPQRDIIFTNSAETKFMVRQNRYLCGVFFFNCRSIVDLWRRSWQPFPVFVPGESPWAEEPGGLQPTGSQRVRHE